MVGASCSAPWNVTLEKRNFTLWWSGAEREADLVVDVRPVDPSCSRLQLVAPFSNGVVHTEDVCANTDYSVDVRLICARGERRDGESVRWRLAQNLSSPTNLTAVEVTNTSVLLEWEAPPHPVHLYEVIKSKEEEFNSQDTFQAGATTYLLAGLVAYTRYFVKVRARTESAIGPWSSTLSVRTDIGVPFTPLRVRATTVTNSSIALSWEPPWPSTGPVLWYTVAWFENESTDAHFDRVHDTTHTLLDLLPYTKYSVRLRATTAAGDGTWSETINQWTDIGVPSEPCNVTVSNVTSTSISVQWAEPHPANGPLLGYVVSWGARGAAVSLVLVGDPAFHPINLMPYTQYSFQVSARTKAGYGPYSNRVTVHTDTDVPSPPRNLNATEVQNTSATLEWDAPERPNGPLLVYLVRCVEPRGCNDATTNATYARLLGLTPSTDYLVQVIAATEAGEGPPSENLTLRTTLGVPSTLQNVTVTEVTSTSVRLTWLPAVGDPSHAEDFSIAWGLTGIIPSHISTREHHYDALGLRPYTEYTFQISPRNEAGPGPAKTLSLRTGIAAPSFPRDVYVLETTESSALLRWLPPEHPNGPHLGYLLQLTTSSNESEAEGWTNATSFTLSDLDPSTNYSARVAVNNSAGQGPWSPAVVITTKDKGPSRHSSLALALSLGIVLPLLVLLALVLLYFARRRETFKFLEGRGPRKPPPMEPNQTPKSVVQLEIIHPISTSMTVHNFEERMKAKTRQDFTREFEELQRQSPMKSCNEAKLDANLLKNRWVKILPFDHSRVKLLPHEGETRANFINASYVQGSNHLLEYIATQGPLSNTVEDLWRLVWQQGVPLLVMLTQCVERAVRNCEMYWPSSGHSKLYGDVQVQNASESILTSYVQRTFTLMHRSQKRHLVQMHFTNWPMSGCPRSPDEFLHFVRKVREQVSDRRPGPILVHCSAGVGRTGTFIAVDRLQQTLQFGDDIDVFGTVLDMRRYRPHMVHTEEQYAFIYSCMQRLFQERDTTEENIYELLPN